MVEYKGKLVPIVMEFSCNPGRYLAPRVEWFGFNNVRLSDIVMMLNQQNRQVLTQLALFAGHRLYLDYKGEKLYPEYHLTDEATWWNGDIHDHEGNLVAKVPSPEVLDLIRSLPANVLIHPLEMKRVAEVHHYYERGVAKFAEICRCPRCRKKEL